MDRVYRDQVLEVEPTGIEPVTAQQRHGSPRALFGVWFSANAEIATWMVGVTICALYGTSLRGAAVGIIAGNVLGYAILGTLAAFGPKYGVPQMIASRMAFGRYANAVPATLSFLAGVGWFAINTIFGAYALQTIAHLAFGPALALMLAAQIVLAVYGYNMIHRFEALCAVVLAAGFALLGAFTFARASWNAPFNAHAPLAAGGEMGGVLLAAALAFAYATGWLPCASDYSRYLPRSSNERAVWWYAFAGCALPCIVLEIMGAATVNVVHGVMLGDASPTQAIAALLGSAAISTPVLLAVVIGTITANCMNLYSGALAALVVRFPGKDARASVTLGAGFGVATAVLLTLAHVSPATIAAAALCIAAIVTLAGAFELRRWRAAVIVGLLGAVLAAGGAHAGQTARVYTNFLLLLSYWASPWAAVMLVHAWLRGSAPAESSHTGWGAFAWLAGLLCSIPFWNQVWYTGPFAGAFPQCGDLSYYAGFAVAALVAALQPNARSIARS